MAGLPPPAPGLAAPPCPPGSRFAGDRLRTTGPFGLTSPPRAFRVGDHDVDCGVEIAVDGETADVAAVRTHGERQLGFHCPARRARLAGRIEAVHHMQGNAGPRALVLELAAKLTERCVLDGLGEAVACHHSRHAQVLDRDFRVASGETCRELLEVVAALVGDAGMDALDAAPCPGATP